MESDSRWLLLALTGMAGIASVLIFPQFLMYLGLSTVFLGVLTSVSVGFTLKAPQLFSMVGILAHGLQCFYQPKDAKIRWLPFPAFWALPFLFLLVSFLPSFYNLSLAEASLSADKGALRMLLNLALLFVFVLFMLLRLQTPQDIKRGVELGLLSCALSLIFGFGQQFAFYSGMYDPFAHVGIHNSIVDFYGPFLRFAPGTFANEYGEILQTMGIFVLFMRYEKTKLLPRRGLVYNVFLTALIVALVLNFTRASWLVFAGAALVQLVYLRFSILRLAMVTLLGSGILLGLFYVSQQVLDISLLLQVNARFEELGSPQAYSAGQRLETWRIAWNAFLKAPWIGQGLGKFGQTHNVPLQALAETGLIGFIGFYGFMLWCLRTLWQGFNKSRDTLLRGVIWSSGLALVSCLAFDLTNHGVYHFVLWYCVGLGLAASACAQREKGLV